MLPRWLHVHRGSGCRLSPAARRLLPSRLLPALLATALLGGLLATGLLPRCLLGALLPSALAGRLLPGRLLSSCHLWVTPLNVVSSAGAVLLRARSRCVHLYAAGGELSHPATDGPIGVQNSRLDGKSLAFPSQSAALEPLLRLTLTPAFRVRQARSTNKSRGCDPKLRAISRNRAERGLRSRPRRGPGDRTAPCASDASGRANGSRRDVDPGSANGSGRRFRTPDGRARGRRRSSWSRHPRGRAGHLGRPEAGR